MPSDDDLARDLAAEAGRRLLALRARRGDAGELRAAGDRLSHEFLTAELARQRPGDAVLSEEGRDDPARLAADRVWIVDPLDGTREFGESGRSDWAVHVALWARGELTAGAVALPARDRVLSTADPVRADGDEQAGGARKAGADSAREAGAEGTGEAGAGGTRLAGRGATPLAHLRVVVSRTRPPAFLDRLSEQTGLVPVPLGSAGAKAAAVILGEADAYLHDGGQYEWDSAAPVAVAVAAGFHASRLDGSKLEYNKASLWQPDILICPGKLASRLLTAIGAVRAGTE